MAPIWRQNIGMRLLAVLVVVVCGLPAPASAQQAEPQAPSAPTATATPAVDATKLGVSIARIRRELRQAEAREQEPGTLNLKYHVEVFGQAPRLDFLNDFSLAHGTPMPYGGPTHREFLDIVTPQQFRSPVVPIYGIAMWAAQKLHEKGQRSRCEQEIAEYRQLVMQGVNVAAPRCANQ